MPKQKHKNWFDENKTGIQLLNQKMHSTHKLWTMHNKFASKKHYHRAINKPIVKENDRRMVAIESI